MTNIVANSVIARAVRSVSALIENSATFVDRCANYGTFSAADSVYGYSAESALFFENSLKTRRPFAVVALNTDVKWSPTHEGCANTNLLVGGGVVVVLVDNAQFTNVGTFDEENKSWTDGPDHKNDSYVDFLNFCGGVIDDMSPKANQAPGTFKGFNSPVDLIGFREVELLETPVRSMVKERSEEDFWSAYLLFKWGQN